MHIDEGRTCDKTHRQPEMHIDKGTKIDNSTRTVMKERSDNNT